MRVSLGLFFTLLSSAALAQTVTVAPSAFDCSKAYLGVDYVICSDAGLIELVNRLSEQYFKVRNAAEGEARAALIAEQRAWVNSYGSNCGLPARGRKAGGITVSDQACVREAMVLRVIELAAAEIKQAQAVAQPGLGTPKATNSSPPPALPPPPELPPTTWQDLLPPASYAPVDPAAGEGLVRVICLADGQEMPAGRIVLDGRQVGDCPRADVFAPAGSRLLSVVHLADDGRFRRGQQAISVRDGAAQRLEVPTNAGFVEEYYVRKEDWAGLLKAFPNGKFVEHATRAAAFEAEEEFYKSNTPDVYLKKYPTGFYVKAAKADVERNKQAGKIMKDCADCPEMVVVPAGSYDRGSPESEEGRDSNEGPVRRVTIPRAFAVGRYEVSFAEWDACVADGGCGAYRPDDKGWGRGKQPVMNVRWDDAQGYVAWLSRKTGERYRLLTEAEWEYVARAGTTTPFWWGASISPDQANYSGDYTYGTGRKGKYRQRTVPVDSFAANPFGLYNVHGNVQEWVEDCYVDNYRTAPIDGTAASGLDSCFRVLRGGFWFDEPRLLRSAVRFMLSPDYRSIDVGFRLARMLSN
jgi:formylglycine-generating enzyme required for sulfatase activity/uncharacterized protein